jgi:predicted methyltransferase
MHLFAKEPNCDSLGCTRLRPYHWPETENDLRSSRRRAPVDRNGQKAMSKPIKSGRKGLLAAVGVSAGLFLNAPAATTQQSRPPLSSEQIAQIVKSTDRTAADRTNDERRKPEQMLGFIGIRPGIVAVDLSAGGGYTTELLARAIGPSGKVYGRSRPRDPNRVPTPPVAPEGNPITTPSAAPAAPASTPRLSPVALAERENNLRSNGVQAAPIVALSRPFEDPVPSELAVESIDLATLMFNYHDLGHLGVDRGAMNKAVFGALKSGGLYVIADHSGRPGSGISESGTLHRIEEAFLRQEVEAAGFKLMDEGNFLRNPNDPRDKNTPDPPQPKDEFVLKFVKP